MNPRPTATWQLLDIATGGQALDWLASHRAEGASHDLIADLIAAEFGIHVSREWVRQRCIDIKPATKSVA